MKKSIILGLFVVLALASCKNASDAPPAEAALVEEAAPGYTPAADTTSAEVDTTAKH